jgi:enoyl-[acyl-carrier protein] reductase II
VLAQEILPHIRDVPVFVAGGLGRGEAILGYLEMGAAGAQLGTRFAASTESIAHANFKNAFIRANARDALPSVQLDERFPVIPVRGLMNEGTRRFMAHQAEVLGKFQSGELDKTQAQLSIEHFWAGALRRAVVDGDVEAGSVMAGQSVGMVTSVQPVATIIAELNAQAIDALTARNAARGAAG